MHRTLFSPDVYVYEIRFLTVRKIKTLRLVENGEGGGGLMKILCLREEII
jgi:hypothetical protein